MERFCIVGLKVAPFGKHSLVNTGCMLPTVFSDSAHSMYSCSHTVSACSENRSWCHLLFLISSITFHHGALASEDTDFGVIQYDLT